MWMSTYQTTCILYMSTFDLVNNSLFSYLCRVTLSLEASMQ